MGAATGENDALNGRFADEAGFSEALIDPVLELEEATDTVGIDIIGDRRTTEPDGALQNFTKGEAEAFEFISSQAARLATRPNASAEEALVGVDIAHAGEEGLVEQSGLDGEFTATKESGEGFGLDLKGLSARSGEGLGLGKIAEFEAAEAAWVDEAEFTAAGESEAGVGVGSDGRIGCGDKKAASHTEVHDPLHCVGRTHCGRQTFGGGLCPRAQAHDDVFADAFDAEDGAAFEAFGLVGGGILEGLAVRAEPDVGDAVVAYAGVDAASDGFHLGEFGHRLIVVKP